MIISSLSPFTLNSCLLSYCSAWHLPFCSGCFTMRWMNGLTSHCTEDSLALLGIGRGLCSFPCVLHVDIQIHNLAELKLCLLFWGSRMCIFILLLDCSAEIYQGYLEQCVYNFLQQGLPYKVELGGLCPHLHIWLLRITHWKRRVHILSNSASLDKTVADSVLSLVTSFFQPLVCHCLQVLWLSAYVRTTVFWRK